MSDRPGIWSRPLFNLSLRGWRRLFACYPDQIERRLRVRILISACITSAMEGMQQRLFGAQLDAAALPDPVFIIGHWRSGTTLLHELMALDDGLLTPTTHQCFNPQSFLLSGGRKSGATMVRPTGDRMVSSGSPQEEEFALLCLGCRSPYEAFMFPAAMHRLSELCDPEEFAAPEREDWDRRLIGFLKAVTLGGGNRRLLLKSPTNTFRIATLRRLFPNAAFVQIVREPAPVVVSTIDLWNRMWERYAFGAPLPDSELREIVIDTWLRMEEKIQAQMQSGCGAFLTIRYEELTAQPHQTIERVYAELRLGPSPAADRISGFLAASPPLRQSHSVSAAVEAAVRERCAIIRGRYGYQNRPSPDQIRNPH
jgi:hypothetical protein